MCEQVIQQTLVAFSRRKQITTTNVLHSQLRRCLNVFDLTTLGIGSTLGAGIYILAGTVARNLAGPGVLLSFCYAELGSKYPRAASAYVYSYVIIGELAAFIIGCIDQTDDKGLVHSLSMLEFNP
jgi:L-asparagine transporter-like permease